MIRKCPSCGRKNRTPVAHLADSGRCGACKATIPPIAEPINATEANFDEIISEAKVPVLVDFWAAWCGPCRMVAPEVAKTAEIVSGKALLVKVDTEACPQLAQRYNVMSIPNFGLFHQGKLLRQNPGAVGSDTMVRWLTSF